MAGLFLTVVQILSEFVGGQCASRRLPPKAAVSACRRHSFVEGIRNGGLDVLKTAAVLENPFWALEAAGPATVFSFPVLRGRIAWLIRFILAPVWLPLSAGQNSHR